MTLEKTFWPHKFIDPTNTGRLFCNRGTHFSLTNAYLPHLKFTREAFVLHFNEFTGIHFFKNCPTLLSYNKLKNINHIVSSIIEYFVSRVQFS